MRSGESERPLYDALMAKVDGANVGPIEALGIPRPTFGLILEEGKILCGSMQAWLQQTMQDDREALRRAAYQAEGEIKRDEAAGDAEKKPISLEAHAHTMQVILESPGGIGTPVHRVANYVEVHPDAVAVIPLSARGEVVAELESRGWTIASTGLIANATLMAAAPTLTDAVIDGVVVQSSIDLGRIQGERMGTAAIELLPHQTAIITFTLEQASMVNLWVDTGTIGSVRGVGMPMPPDLALELSGSALETTYISDKKDATGARVPTAAESVSSVLPAGTYTLTVRDHTAYPPLSLGVTGNPSLPPIPVQFEMRPYNTAQIIGRVSIERSGFALPVSMRVAAFDSAGKRIDFDPITKEPLKLDADKPVWVVIHGRKDSEEGNNIDFLARVLSEKRFQVVTVDWHQAAQDNGLLLNELKGADWIAAVGKWTANQLMAVGFSGDKVVLPDHSWGTFVGYEIGKNFKAAQAAAHHPNPFGVQAIVALDTPLDPLPNSYPVHEVVFSDVAKVSWALRSSFFGSPVRSNTANVNFDIISPSESLEQLQLQGGLLSPLSKAALDAAEAYFGEHGYAVSYVANLLKGIGDASLSILNINDLLSGTMPALKVDSSGPEGYLPITLEQGNGPEGTYWQAVPTIFIPLTQ